MNTKFATSSKTYLPGLDGLRAVSVILVLLFHARIAGFGGGFIGVDVFFAISGYIITRQIAGQLDLGTFSMLKFWKRRVARLLPAMLCVVFATLIAGFFILGPTDLSRLGKSSMFTSVSLSNFFFWQEAGYFDDASHTKPLLHTWSLAVEEQFYLCWPIAMSLLFLLGKRKSLILGITLASLISVIASFILSKEHASAVFFMMPFRIFQFGIGAVIALMVLPKLSTTLGNALTIVGVVSVVILGMIVRDTNTPFWLSAIAPVVAAGLIFVSINSPVSEKILGCRPMTYIGQRAYSIYLVHWPLMVYTFMIKGTHLPLWISVILLIASLIGGIVLYKFIETPLRFKSSTLPIYQRITLISTGVAVFTSFTIGAGFASKIISQVTDESNQSEIAQFEANLVKKRQEMTKLARYGTCASYSKVGTSVFDPDVCFKIAKNKPTLFVMGDSYSDGAYVALTQGKLKNRYSVAQAGYSGCWPVDLTDLNRPEDCTIFNIMRMNQAEKGKYAAIVLASSWEGPSIEHVAPIIRRMRASGKDVIIIGVRARFTESIPRLITMKKSVSSAEAVMRNYMMEGYKKRHEKNNALRNIAEAEGALFINVLDTQCSDTSCPAVAESFNPYRFKRALQNYRATIKRLSRFIKIMAQGDYT